MSSPKPLKDVGLTDRESKLLAAAWLSCNSGDNIDYAVFATLAGYPSVVNARKRFWEVKRAVRQRVFGSSEDVVAPIATPSKAALTKGRPSKTKEKRKKAAEGEDVSPVAKRAKSITTEPEAGEERPVLDEFAVKDLEADDEVKAEAIEGN